MYTHVHIHVRQHAHTHTHIPVYLITYIQGTEKSLEKLPKSPNHAFDRRAIFLQLSYMSTLGHLCNMPFL